MTNKYVLVGGNPIRSYTGTGTFTGLHVVGHAETLEGIKELFTEKYDQCGGLLVMIELATGQEVT